MTIAGVGVLKAVDIGYRFGFGWASLWVVAAAALGMRNRSLRYLPMAIVAWGFAFSPTMWSNHIIAIAWLATACTLFPNPEQRRVAVTASIVALYLFAGLSKLNPIYLSGEVVARYPWGFMAPAPRLLAVAGLVAELLLAALLIVRRSPGLTRVLSLALHVSIVLVMSRAWDDAVRMVVFNGLLVGAVWFVTQPATRHRSPGGSGLQKT